jgi:hypothetical protein
MERPVSVPVTVVPTLDRRHNTATSSGALRNSCDNMLSEERRHPTDAYR